MKLRLLIAFCMLFTTVCCQQKSLFKFIVDRPSIDTFTGAYYGMQFEFSSERVYVSQNEFSERGLFTQGDKDKSVIFFKQSGRKWHIKNGRGKWQLFYPVINPKSSPIIKFNGKNFQIEWKQEESFGGKKVAVFKLKLLGFISNHQPDYYFDSIKGIVGLRTSEVTLIREDFR